MEPNWNPNGEPTGLISEPTLCYETPMSETTHDPIQFKPITPEAYKNLDAKTKDRQIQARHLGIIRMLEKKITQLLIEALTVPRQMADGVRPYRHDELVVVCMHREEPIVPTELRKPWEMQEIEVGLIVSERASFAAGIAEFVTRLCANPDCGRSFAQDAATCCYCNAPANPAAKTSVPYRHAAGVLKNPSPPATVYVAVFDTGMCTVTFLGFNAADPAAETVPADPNVPAPRAVEPLPRMDPKPAIGSGSGNADSGT